MIPNDILHQKIIDIADEIELGMTVYVHKTTLDWISLPDMDNYFEIYDDDDWVEDRNKLNADRANYVEIPRVLPRRMFVAMERFAADVVQDASLKAQIEAALQMQHPFRHFKNVVYHSGAKYKNAWHRFRGELYYDWVCEHLDLLLNIKLQQIEIDDTAVDADVKNNHT